jgi:hypothetical protein
VLALALGAGVGVGVGVGVIGPAAAQTGDGSQEADGVQITVEAGIDGRYLVGRRLPVTVGIESDRLLRGTVEVAVDGMSGTWSTPVEVPGGSDKDVVVVVASPASFPISSVGVRIRGAGEEIRVEAEVEALDGDELAGLLPGVVPADLPAPFTFPHGFGVARFAAVDPDELLIAGAIDPLGTIVAGPEELGALDGAARAAVIDWVDRGGRLVVDASPGSAISGLPESWQPGESGRAQAGLGEVRQSDGRASAGDWAEVLEPTPTASAAEFPDFGDMAPFEGVGDALARDAGLDALDLPWLLGFLAAYVVLAGPIAYLLLRRRRASLGWVAIPALAVLFTGIAFVVGADLRSGTTTAHGTVLESSAGSERATTVVGTVSRTGGDGRTTFPAGWTASSVDTIRFGAVEGTSDVAVSTTQAGSAARIPLAAGGFGSVRGTGPVPAADDRLVVEAASVDGAVSGTITNGHPFALSRVGVFVGRATDSIGEIGAGETVEFEIRGDELRLGDPFSPPEAAVWPAESGFADRPVTDTVVNLALLDEALTPLGPNARPRGVVTVIGWTRELASPVDSGGSTAPGRSAVITRAPVAASPGEVARGAARREIVRGPEGVEVFDADLPGGIRGIIWQFDVPAGTGDVPLALAVPAYVPRIDAWDGTRWMTLDKSPGVANAGFNQVRTVEVPADLAAGGTLVARGFVQVDFGPVGGDGVDLFTLEAP